MEAGGCSCEQWDMVFHSCAPFPPIATNDLPQHRQASKRHATALPSTALKVSMLGILCSPPPLRMFLCCVPGIRLPLGRTPWSYKNRNLRQARQRGWISLISASPSLWLCHGPLASALTLWPGGLALPLSPPRTGPPGSSAGVWICGGPAWPLTQGGHSTSNTENGEGALPGL